MVIHLIVENQIFKEFASSNLLPVKEGKPSWETMSALLLPNFSPFSAFDK